ncbi:MAG: hypothetical protein U0V70_12075 [Terriglobia bacterium]
MKRHGRGLMITALVVLLLTPAPVYPQILNPSYLSEMPMPARILAEIKGKDTEDTGERQMGAFMALIKIMDDMAWGLGHRYVDPADTRKQTPDEGRIRLGYQTAYADLWHKVTNKEGHVYDHDRDLLNEILNKFFSENFRTLYSNSNANAAAAYKAHQEKMYGNPANAAPAQPASQAAAPGSQTELRRCVASGRSLRTCMTEGMGSGFEQMIGISLKQPVPAGFRMTGDYSSSSGFRLIFEPEQVTMVCRGVPAPRPYTVQITDTQALVTIQNESKSVVFSLRPDGKLSGSGPIHLTGQVPTGSHTQQTMGMTTQKTTATRELTPLEAGNRQDAIRNGQVFTVQEDATQLVYGPTGTQTVTEFTTKAADCTLGLMSPIGSSPLPHLPKNDFDVLTTIGAGMGTLMKGGNLNDATKEMLFPEDEKNIVPGLRMNGYYSGESGFSLHFHPESVTVGCGDAERALQYSVEHSGNKTMLVIKDTPNPIALQIMPDGSISGEGTVQVNGRIITGTTDDMNNPFVFAPQVARCSVGRLVAGEPGTRPPAVTPPSPPAQVSSATDTGSRPATVAGTSLKITAGPGVSSLLAGKALVVLKDNLENILGSVGINAPAGSSRISAWTHACEHSPRDALCQQGATSLAPYIVAKTGFDGNGVATFNNVPSSGTFFVLADTSYAHHLIWNLRVDLHPGANAIVLDERNSSPIDR